MHHSNPFPIWFSAATNAWFLGLEAAMVIGLRSFKLAQGGATAQAETQRMISEKIAALFELQQLGLAGKLGETMPDAVGKTVAHYRRAVRANRRRLAV